VWNFETKPCLRPAPLRVDPFVLAARPEVLELYLFESGRLQLLDVSSDPSSVTIGAVGERVPHCVGHLIQRLAWRQTRFQQQHVGDLLLEAIRSFEHVIQADQLAVRADLDLEHGRQGDSFALFVDVSAGLGGFGVLAGG